MRGEARLFPAGFGVDGFDLLLPKRLANRIEHTRSQKVECIFLEVQERSHAKYPSRH